VGASALCFVTWNYAVHLLGPVKTSVYIYLVPLITIAASALVLHETITLVAGIGMALILVGMALSEREKASYSHHPTEF
jgi:drug/metabolite transporter (DMT)-like permease